MLPATSGPRRTRGTATASAASTDHASCTGWSTFSSLGMKWSANHSPSQPVASACRQHSMIAETCWSFFVQNPNRIRTACHLPYPARSTSTSRHTSLLGLECGGDPFSS